MREHITPVLASLHWLPVVFRIDFKILLLVYKALNGMAPLYLSDCLDNYVPGRPLRSASQDLLEVPTMTYKKYGKAAFCYYGPTVWNKLPVYLRQAPSVDSFKTQLKTHFFNLAFCWTLSPCVFIYDKVKFLLRFLALSHDLDFLVLLLVMCFYFL